MVSSQITAAFVMITICLIIRPSVSRTIPLNKRSTQMNNDIDNLVDDMTRVSYIDLIY